ncbi:MAG: hypothetical protein L0210_10490 [Rhodospirillales bacterium]|nr:hypothetical protein [Rhodospirillales bacterium]
MRGIAALIGTICIVAFAARSGPGQAEEAVPPRPELPPPSRLLPGQVQRATDGSIALQEAARSQLRVCPKPQGPACQFTDLAAAAAAAAPGTEIVLAPGVYEQGAVLAADGLILRGEPGAHLKGHPVQGKAALVVTGAGVVIDGIECSGIEVPDQNGACIRIEGDDLTVRNVNFHDNQQGILSSSLAKGTLLVEDSQFERNGHGGRAHGLYIGRSVDNFIFRRNLVLSTRSEGHGVKSRARRSVIEDNVIASLEGNDSRAIDLPNGGEVSIRGNMLEKGPDSTNNQMIGIALEGNMHQKNAILIEDNLIIFDPQVTPLSKLLSAAESLTPKRGLVIRMGAPVEVILNHNVVIGAKSLGVDDAEAANVTFATRQAAHLPPYPDVSPSLLEQVRSLIPWQ